MSVGISRYIDEINDLIDTLLAVGILPVCAVGNDGFNRTDAPANCRGAVSVGAANSRGKVAHFSGSGTISINNHLYNVPYLVAPGEGVYSSVPGGGYEAWDGTSMATPIVSGVAALILEKYDKQISVGRLIDALLDNCQDLGQDRNRQVKKNSEFRIQNSEYIPINKFRGFNNDVVFKSAARLVIHFLHSTC